MLGKKTSFLSVHYPFLPLIVLKQVEIYELCSSNETTIHFVTETKTEGKLTFDLQFLLMAHVIRNMFSIWDKSGAMHILLV